MLESGSWGHSVLQTPALVSIFFVVLFSNENSEGSDIRRAFKRKRDTLSKNRIYTVSYPFIDRIMCAAGVVC